MDPRPPDQFSPPKELGTTKIETWAKSISSEKHPNRNEDAIFRLSEGQAFGVFDGVGGHNGGEIASRIAQTHVGPSLKKFPDGLSLQETQESLRRVLLEANDKILEQARVNPTLEGMGTTASVVYIWEGKSGERKAVIANVGDSRVYKISKSGVFEQITLDDNLLSENVQDENEARKIQEKLNNTVDPLTLNDSERFFYDTRNTVTQALGSGKVIEPRIKVIDIQTGDKIIVTCDGIHDNLTDKEIADIATKSKDNQVAVDNLIKAAQDRSKDVNHPRNKMDDMSVIIAEISPIGQARIEPPKPLAHPQPKQTERLSEGGMVRVHGDNGVIEKGWKIFGFNPETKDAIVRKMEGRHVFYKYISPEELKALNPPKQEAGIGGATDFPQLFKALDDMGKTQGSQQTFEPDRLKQLINDVRNGTRPIDVITRSGGLREQVDALIAVERIRAALKAFKSNN